MDVLSVSIFSATSGQGPTLGSQTQLVTQAANQPHWACEMYTLMPFFPPMSCQKCIPIVPSTLLWQVLDVIFSVAQLLPQDCEGADLAQEAATSAALHALESTLVPSSHSQVVTCMSLGALTSHYLCFPTINSLPCMPCLASSSS